jgi:ribosomal protein S18 acetylase RimI-like enzyme
MTEGMDIRTATETDLPELLALHAQLSRPGEDPTPISIEAASAILERIAAYPDYAVYVAADRASGAILGTFALLIMDNLAHAGRPSAVVEDVCVDSSLRRQGIGRAMMQSAMERARQRGCYKLTLSSNLAREGAHAFYRSLGFVQHGLSFHVALPG